jgi:membrane protein implicated in regulation of membrane protease activity
MFKLGATTVMLITMIVFAQTVPAPPDLVTLQWIVITALAGVVGYLFRQLRKEEKRHTATEKEMLKKTLVGLGEANEVIRSLGVGIEAIQHQFSVLKEIERLRNELQDSSRKDK